MVHASLIWDQILRIPSSTQHNFILLIKQWNFKQDNQNIIGSLLEIKQSSNKILVGYIFLNIYEANEATHYQSS